MCLYPMLDNPPPEDECEDITILSLVAKLKRRQRQICFFSSFSFPVDNDTIVEYLV